MRRVILAVLLSAGVAHAQPAPGAAGSPEAQKEAPHFMAVTGKQELLDTTVEHLNLMAMAMLARGGMSFADRSVMTTTVLMPELHKSAGALMQEWTQIFASALSVDDMKALEAFYATPAGQRIMTAEVQITNSIQVATLSWELPAIKAAILKHADELRAHGYEE